METMFACLGEILRDSFKLKINVRHVTTFYYDCIICK